MSEADELFKAKTEETIPRDQWGRPQIKQPDGSLESYTRVSTLAKALDDTHNLTLWAKRMVARGVAISPDLIAVFASMTDPNRDRDTKKAADEYAEQAMERAKSSTKRVMGTAIHSFTEQYDRGQTIEHVPAEVAPDLRSYVSATKDVTWLAFEEFVVVDRIKAAGTMDRLGRRGNGPPRVADIKGLALDTVLPTPTGWTTMGEVKVGDEVFGPDGKPTTVVLKSEPKRIGTYIVTFGDGARITCDSEHIWWTSTARPEIGLDPQPRTVQEVHASLRDGRGQARHRVPVAEPLVLPEASLPIDPYVLGAWLGDGAVRGGEICKEDALFDLIEADGNKLGIRQVDSRSGAISRTVVGLTAALKRSGLQHNKHIPPEYLRASIQQRLRLLQGLMDTDGTWNTARNRATFYTVNEALAGQVMELLYSLGQKPHLAEVVRTGFGKTVTSYDVEFRPLGLSPFRLPRKVAKISGAETFRSTNRLIVSIEPGPDVETACIGVDNDTHVYLAGREMIPTHNTGSVGDYNALSFACQLAMYAAGKKYDPATGARIEHGEVIDQEVGEIIHVAQGEGKTTIYEVDLEVGRRAVTTALSVRDLRKTKGIMVERKVPTISVMQQLAACTTIEELRAVWAATKDSWTEKERKFSEHMAADIRSRS